MSFSFGDYNLEAGKYQYDALPVNNSGILYQSSFILPISDYLFNNGQNALADDAHCVTRRQLKSFIWSYSESLYPLSSSWFPFTPNSCSTPTLSSHSVRPTWDWWTGMCLQVGARCVQCQSICNWTLANQFKMFAYIKSQQIQMNTSFDAYLMADRPTITPKAQTLTMTRHFELDDDLKEFWGFYLLKGSEVTVSTCARYMKLNLHLFKKI